jgi:hypothetical protein
MGGPVLINPGRPGRDLPSDLVQTDGASVAQATKQTIVFISYQLH